MGLPVALRRWLPAILVLAMLGCAPALTRSITATAPWLANAGFVQASPCGRSAPSTTWRTEVSTAKSAAARLTSWVADSRCTDEAALAATLDPVRSPRAAGADSLVPVVGDVDAAAPRAMPCGLDERRPRTTATGRRLAGLAILRT